MNLLPHQYIERYSHQIVTEKPIGDRSVHFLYHTLRESSPTMFRLLTSGRMSSLLSFFHYDLPTTGRRRGREIFNRIGADWRECVQPLDYYDSYRKVFERQIRYWETRPINRNLQSVVSPADARVIIGSFADTSSLFIKEKFFDLDELLGVDSPWGCNFENGDFAVFRLTPDKYHYNHVPVSGKVVDSYTLDGSYHSCNPSALVALASLYSKNRRVVTIIDTDVEGGTGVGLVAMIEIVALMIGDICQAYSASRYENPTGITPGMFLQKGAPKSLFRPGSSTDVLIFTPHRTRFAEDLVANSRRQDIRSRFSSNLDRPLVETDVLVRSAIAEPVSKPNDLTKEMSV